MLIKIFVIVHLLLLPISEFKTIYPQIEVMQTCVGFKCDNA